MIVVRSIVNFWHDRSELIIPSLYQGNILGENKIRPKIGSSMITVMPINWVTTIMPPSFRSFSQSINFDVFIYLNLYLFAFDWIFESRIDDVLGGDNLPLGDDVFHLGKEADD